MPTDSRRDDDRIGVQFSLYPLRQEHLRPAIEKAVTAAAGEGLRVRVGSLSTYADGDEETAFRATRAAFDAARSLGPVVMTVTFASRVPGADAVAEIQAASGT